MAPGTVRIPPDVVYREQGDAIVAMSLRSGDFATLTDVGARIWTLIARVVSLDDILETLAGEYDITVTDCREDVLAFVTDLHAKRLLDMDAGAAAR